MPVTITLLITVCLTGWFWYNSARARETAIRVAAETCRRQDLQFLDETVALQRIRLRRDAWGRMALERTYQFEYSEDRATRLRGFVIALGGRVETVGLAAPNRHPHPPPGD